MASAAAGVVAGMGGREGTRGVREVVGGVAWECAMLVLVRLGLVDGFVCGYEGSGCIRFLEREEI